MDEDADDSETIAWSLAGDRAAFLELFTRHSTAVHAYLARRAGRAEADDLLAEVWLQAFRSRSNFEGSWTDARPWLFGIARNILRAHWRIRLRADPRYPDLEFDPWAEVDARIAAGALGDALRDALGRLSDDEREVLLLVAWEHLSPTEAAVALNIPAGTARSRLHRARQVLQGELEVQLETPRLRIWKEAP